MKVSQAAIDEVRAVRLADEAKLQYEKLMELTKLVDCCAICSRHEDRSSHMFCNKHEMDTRPYLVCDDYQR